MIQIFTDDRLNSIGMELISLEESTTRDVIAAMNKMKSAFINRWKSGKIIYENYDYIIEKCLSQKNFADKVGMSEGVVSNNLRGYKSLLDRGCVTESDVLRLLDEKNIKPTVRHFEKIDTLLSMESLPAPVSQPERDINRLMEISDELSTIVNRSKSHSADEVSIEAEELLEYTKQTIDFINSTNYFEWNWKSEKYLNFIRYFGRDLITQHRETRVDPHHTLPNGVSSRQGRKISDVFTIPVSRDTHQAIESGHLRPTQDQIKDILIECMSKYIMLTK